MNDTNLEILVTLKDEASAAFAKVGDNVADTSKSMQSSIGFLKTDVSGLSKTMLGLGVAGVGAAVAFGMSTIKAFSEAQVQVAKMDATLQSMTNTSLTVTTGLTKTVNTLKVTGIEALTMQAKIDAANVSLQTQSLRLQELDKQHQQGKISAAVYQNAVASTKSQVQQLTLSIQDYKEKLGAVDSKQEEVTKTVTLSAKQIAEAREQILKLSEAAVKLGFDDEDVAQSLVKFYQRTADLTKAQQLNAIAMDLSRAKSIDLQSAVNLVNMALSGQGKVLAQYGISIKDGLSPLEALSALQKQVSGQAAAFSQTFQGQMEVLSVSFGNIKEQIGEVLVKALVPFIMQFTAWLNDPTTKKMLDEYVAEFRSWAEVVIPLLIDTFKAWVDVGRELFQILTSVGNAMFTIVDAMNNLSKNGTGGFSGLISAWKNAGSNLMWAAQGGIPGRASGGPVGMGQPYMVGEEGPELFIPGMSGTIIPNGASAGGGSIVLNINNLYGTDEDAARKFADMIARDLGRQLKLKTY